MPPCVGTYGELVFLPSRDTPEAVMDWASERGLTDVTVYRGEDGLLRGFGIRRAKPCT